MSSLTGPSSTSTDSVDPLDPYASWTSNALQVRKAWMRMMGMSEDDIRYHCEQDPPIDLDEELKQYNAMFAIQREEMAE